LGGDRLVGELFGAGTLVATVFFQVQRLGFGLFNAKYLLGRWLVAGRRLFGFVLFFYVDFHAGFRKEFDFLYYFLA
jgi:hypothetical protein